MPVDLRVLIVQSTPQDTQLVNAAIVREAVRIFDVVSASTVEAALNKLTENEFDLVLLSWSLPDNLEIQFAIRLLKESSGVAVLHLRSLLTQSSARLDNLPQPDNPRSENPQVEFDRSAIGILARTLATSLKARQPQAQTENGEINRIKASEERYALAIEGMKDGIWDWDLEKGSVYYSRQWLEMLGLTAKDVSDTPQEWLGRVHPEDVDLLRRSLEDYFTHRCAYFRCEYRIRHANGTYLWVLGRGGALWDKKDRPYRIVGSQTDVTCHKQLEESLAQEKEQVEDILKSMGDAVITINPQGLIVDFNPEAEKLTGWSAAMAINKPVSEVCQLIDGTTLRPLKSPSLLAIEQGRGFSMSSHPMLVSRQGDRIAVDDSAAPIRDKSGAILGAVMVLRDVSIERDRAERLAWQASHDPLTGLANRQYFVEQLARASEQPGSSHVVCYLDLDHFKIVNDTCGHAAGDELLRQISALLNTNVRQSDLIARLGGDEFGLIIYDCRTDSAHSLACKLCKAIQKFRFLWNGKVFSIGVSIGLVPIPPEGATATRLMSLADAACYAAKNKGRNQVQVYSEENEDMMQMSADFEWFSRITQAIENDSFCLYAQEIKPVGNSGKESIQEILLRLPDPITHCLMPPMAFIPPAERYDLMPKLDRWTIRQCFKQLENVHTHNVLYSINLSGDTLNDDSFVGFVQKTLTEFRVDPHRICFEITETTAISNLAQVAAMILSLKKLGFRFALDDFGSGMSSFVYLKQLPVDYLKIDGSLVSEIAQDEVALATLKSINDIGHIMGLSTVAEYVADRATLKIVKGLNIDYVQGYAISKPKPFRPINQQPAERMLRKPVVNNRR